MKQPEPYENLTLAIDTSSKASSVALASDQTLIASVNIAGSSQTSRILFREIESILSLSGVQAEQIDRFGAITGPGSFTGLRVGLAVVESMSRTLRRPAIGITAFDAVASSIGTSGTVAVLLEAGKSEVFCGIRTVTADRQISVQGVDRVCDAGGVLEYLADKFSGTKLIVTGTSCQAGSIPVQSQSLPSIDASRWIFISSSRFLASAAARLAALRATEDNSDGLRAYYIKPPDALAKSTKARDQPSPDVTIGPVETGEIDTVVRLEMDGGLTSRGAESYRNFLNEDGALLLVARRGPDRESSTVVGSVSGLVVGGELQIDNVVVDPMHRRQGIGQQLMKYAMREAFGRGATSVVLEVRMSGEAARALYQALGFIEAGRRKDYYASPREDALTMTLQLEDSHSHVA